MVRAARHADDGAGPLAGRPDADRRLQGRVPVFPAGTFEGIHAAGHFYAGDPAGARERVARHRDIGGINYMALETCFGDVTIAEALQSAELLATEVMPHFA
jgi:hypothetical protein